MEKETGLLIIQVYVDSIAQPINDAKVEILDTNIVTYTNIDGKTPPIELETPSSIYSEIKQDEIKPYSTYNIRVSKKNLTTTIIENVQVFPKNTSIQNVFLAPPNQNSTENIVDIDDISLWNDSTKNNSNRVLPYTFVPEYIIVHDGTPSDNNAPNYYVAFPDYIKNVASSEIYSTWPKETIIANVIAIISFTLNRIYTEWYPSKGYNFTITSSPTYDQKYTRNRTIFENISNIVDEYFNKYIKTTNNNYPILAKYLSDTNTKGILSQWGSKYLGDKGYNAINILKYYYGNSITIGTAPIIDSFPSSFPGYNLKLNSCGAEIQIMQNELNTIRGNYPKIPIIPNANGKFDKDTETSVKTFQQVFNLPVSGIIDFATWYKISYIYTAVSNLTKGIYN